MDVKLIFISVFIPIFCWTTQVPHTVIASPLEYPTNIPTNSFGVQHQEGLQLNGNGAQYLQQTQGIPGLPTQEGFQYQPGNLQLLNQNPLIPGVQHQEGLQFNGNGLQYLQQNQGIPGLPTQEGFQYQPGNLQLLDQNPLIPGVQHQEGLQLNGNGAQYLQQNQGIPKTQTQTVENNIGFTFQLPFVDYLSTPTNQGQPETKNNGNLQYLEQQNSNQYQVGLQIGNQPGSQTGIKAMSLTSQSHIEIFWGITWFVAFVTQDKNGIIYDNTDNFCHITLFVKKCSYVKFQLVLKDNKVIFKEWSGTTGSLGYLQMESPIPTTEASFNFSYENSMKVCKNTLPLVAYPVQNTSQIQTAVVGELILVATDMESYALFVQYTRTGTKVICAIRESAYTKQDRSYYKNLFTQLAQSFGLPLDGLVEVTTQWEIKTSDIKSIFGNDSGNNNQTPVTPVVPTYPPIQQQSGLQIQSGHMQYLQQQQTTPPSVPAY